MKRMMVALAAVAIPMLPTPSVAQELTAAQLYEFCQTPPTASSNPADDWKGLTCASFIYGFTSAHEMVTALQTDAMHPDEFKPLYCAPKETSEGQFQTIFNAYAIANPSKLNQPAKNALFAAFSLAFPCPWLDRLLKR